MDNAYLKILIVVHYILFSDWELAYTAIFSGIV